MRAENTKFVFVYGSLLNKEQALKEIRTETWNGAKPAILNGFRRIYNKLSSSWGGTVLNVEESPKHSVLGLLFGPLEKEEFDRVGRRECWPGYCSRIHYQCVPKNVKILPEGTAVDAYTSIAESRFVGTGAIPLEYQKMVEEGIRDLSKKFNLPELVENYEENAFYSNGEKIVPLVSKRPPFR